ncbi:SH3 domain-containing protein [Leptospira adleri]|uniref:SH3 domain-containing protein n=1 Tax=Leptospira adleri TaxID=2023186 RepID=UPI000F64A756|nr:SH3 domain-containing protein [Leptospira adleri]
MKSPVSFKIDRNIPYDVLSAKVQDTDSVKGSAWIKIRQKEKVGYVQLGDAHLQYGIQLFMPVVENKYGIVTATQLLLRDYPGTNGKIIEKLKTRELVEILDLGQNQISVQGTNGVWAKVKAKNDNIGFLFVPYIMRGSSSEELLEKKNLEVEEEGWGYLVKPVDRIFSYFNEKFQSKDVSELREGDFIKVKKRIVTPEGKVFFHVIKDEAKTPFFEEETKYNVLVDGYIPSNYLKVSRRYASLHLSVHPQNQINRKIIEKLDSLNSKDIDMNSLLIDKFTFKGKSYFAVTTKFLSNYTSCEGFFCGDAENIFVFVKSGNDYEKIFETMGDKVTFYDYGGYNISVTDISPPEGEGPSGVETKRNYKFNGKEFVIQPIE